jgi:1-acyl-sn-glycerol-3-phosphate acyltransferase
MIPARHTSLAQAFFRAYIPFIVHWQFRFFQLEEMPTIAADRPLLVLANHFSWWDGFTNYYLNQRYLKKRYHVMMLEEELRKRMFLRNIGAFSVKRGQRSILESLSYAASCLYSPENMLLLFPTGRLQTLYAREFPFQKGIERILEKAPENLQVVFSFILPEFGAKPKPGLHAYLRPCEPWYASKSWMEEAFHESFQAVIDQQYSRVW